MFDRFRAFSIRQQVFLALGTACAALLVLGMIWFFLFRTARVLPDCRADCGRAPACFH